MRTRWLAATVVVTAVLLGVAPVAAVIPSTAVCDQLKAAAFGNRLQRLCWCVRGGFVRSCFCVSRCVQPIRRARWFGPPTPTSRLCTRNTPFLAAAMASADTVLCCVCQRRAEHSAAGVCAERLARVRAQSQCTPSPAPLCVLGVLSHPCSVWSQRLSCASSQSPSSVLTVGGSIVVSGSASFTIAPGAHVDWDQAYSSQYPIYCMPSRATTCHATAPHARSVARLTLACVFV